MQRYYKSKLVKPWRQKIWVLHLALVENIQLLPKNVVDERMSKCPFRWTIVNRGQSIANSDEQTWCGYRVKAWPAALPWRISHQKLIYRLPSSSHFLILFLLPYLLTGFYSSEWGALLEKHFIALLWVLVTCHCNLVLSIVAARKLLGSTFWISYSSTFKTSWVLFVYSNIRRRRIHFVCILLLIHL